MRQHHAVATLSSAIRARRFAKKRNNAMSDRKCGSCHHYNIVNGECTDKKEPRKTKDVCERWKAWRPSKSSSTR